MVEEPIGRPRGHLDWLAVEDDALYWLVRFFHERYGDIPLVITENGFCSLDWVALDGKVHDPSRIDQTHRYLKGLKRAVSEGVPVEAYFHWSLMDNFEWAEGYRARFGLVHVDYQTQIRTPKDSAHFYKDVIATNGKNI
jgi:beta-glucosidase